MTITKVNEKIETLEKELRELKRIRTIELQTYPCIKQHPNGQTVLFTGPETGVTLCHTYYKVGFYSKNWFESDFTKVLKAYLVTT